MTQSTLSTRNGRKRLQKARGMLKDLRGGVDYRNMMQHVRVGALYKNTYVYY